MRNNVTLRLIILFLLVISFFASWSQTINNTDSGTGFLENIRMENEMKVVKASTLEVPPQWAVMERQLISTIEKAAPYYVNRFTRIDGSVYGKGPYDDVFEMFYNWPELYAISGNEFLYKTALKEYNAITRSNTAFSDDSVDYNHQLYKEFPRNDDFFHISEGMTAFYNLALGNPMLPANIERARRFAGLYLNEDSDARNYDSSHTIIK